MLYKTISDFENFELSFVKKNDKTTGKICFTNIFQIRDTTSG